MDRRRRWPEPPQTPLSNPRNANSNPNLSPFLHDISNYKTPNPSPSPSPIFFTASKNTPSSRSSARRKPFTPSLPQSKAVRRLRALELEQSKSARRAETCKVKTLKSFSRSVTAWLDFLLENPKECGCQIGAGFDGGRGCKRLRTCKEEEVGVEISAEKVSALRNSLKDVCNLEDLRERMEMHISKKGCNEVLLTMSRLCKSIDERRLKMKAHCPIATDLALKEKSTKVLMCYNPTWLRVGLHIIFGGDSLLNEEGKSNQEDLFLKLIIENQFFTHTAKAKSYAYNKLVEGLYKPGFFEALGSIILKRFLLLVVSLDKAKCESTLPLKCGIDGIDGGSPLLFICHSHIKSSRQAVQEFLSEAMHGEGDLLSHLVILGCKLNYQQFPIAEYDFRVRNLFEDLHDGIILCRAIHLLKNDTSILSKVIAPSDSHKKRLQNCSTAMQYLKQAGVQLTDEDGIQITPEDIVNGDKELTLSILWNMFVHLQVPLLIDRALLAKEISKLKGSNVVLPSSQGNTELIELDLLLLWVQAVCEMQGIKVDNFSSTIEGKAFCCLIDHCFRNEEIHAQRGDEVTMDMDAVTTEGAHNISFIPSVITILGNVPKIFQLCDMLDQDFCYDEKSIVILLVFFSSRLINGKIGDELRYKITQQNYRKTNMKPLIVPQLPFFENTVLSNKFRLKKLSEVFMSPQKKSSGLDREQPASVIETHLRDFSVGNKFFKIQNAACPQGSASILIQSHFRGFTERKKFMRITMAACIVQSAVRSWLLVNSKYKLKTFSLVLSVHEPPSGIWNRYLMFMFERHRFVRIKKSALLIQRAARAWFTQKHQRENDAISAFIEYNNKTAVVAIQSFIRGQNVRSRYVGKLATLEKDQETNPELEVHEHLDCAAIKIQYGWKKFLKHSLHMQKTVATIRIQKHWRCWYLRRNFLCQVAAATEIQASIRSFIGQKTFKKYRFAAMEIQRFVRRQLAWKRLIGTSSFPYGRLQYESYNMTNTYQNPELRIMMDSILKVQRWWKHVLLIRSRTVAAILIQSFIRGWNTRRAAGKKRSSISTIQRWWRNILLTRCRNKSAIVIQTHVRGWIARRKVVREKHNIVVIQSYWKGYVARKDSRELVANLRFRLRKYSMNVDDNEQLINKLVGALSELLGYKSVGSIRHTCATLNTATELSQKCCETLVSAGAIHILLKQFLSLNRGIPDQEVSKLVISTLNNISCYPHLLQVLIDTPHAVEIIFQELLRNKSEVFFVTCALLKKICATQDGLKAIRRLQTHVRRLNNLICGLEKKFELQKRNPHLCTGKDDTMRRLRAAADLMLQISDQC